MHLRGDALWRRMARPSTNLRQTLPSIQPCNSSTQRSRTRSHPTPSKPSRFPRKVHGPHQAVSWSFVTWLLLPFSPHNIIIILIWTQLCGRSTHSISIWNEHITNKWSLDQPGRTSHVSQCLSCRPGQIPSRHLSIPQIRARMVPRRWIQITSPRMERTLEDIQNETVSGRRREHCEFDSIISIFIYSASVDRTHSRRRAMAKNRSYHLAWTISIQKRTCKFQKTSSKTLLQHS